MRSLTFLVACVGCKRWMINQIERGNRQPSVDLSKRLSKVLDVPMAEIRPDLAAAYAEFAEPAQ